MELIQDSYKSDESLLSDMNNDSHLGIDSDDESSIDAATGEVNITENELQPRQVRSVYLITYSQANLEKFQTRESFARAVIKEFESSKVRVLQWVCCLENHKVNGVHYHLAIKMSSNKRWLPVKKRMTQEHGAVLHFSSAHQNYYSAWKYVTKSDQQYQQSQDHPDLTLTGSPQTSNASRRRVGRKRKQNQEKSHKGKKPERLTNPRVSEVILKKRIKTRTELYALAEGQRKEGKVELFNFIVNKNAKKVEELLTTTWEMHNAPKDLSRSKKSRIVILNDCLSEDCVEGCYDEWYHAAIETLCRNEIQVEQFAGAVKTLLEKGRGKFRNILITGPANCGKTFVLKPLVQIYNAFVNPASSTFAWVGAEQSEVMFLNDFRWSQQLIPWHDLLLLLEGECVHLPAPKTHFAADILLTKDTPIFSTSSKELQYVKNGMHCERETEMMAVRWKVFKFHNRIPQNQQREVLPCSRCFARLILEYKE